MEVVDPEGYEASHVHRVYEHIAPHFSATRFKPWPIVERFLRDLPIGSVGVDVGCGNGKYLTVNPDVFIVGSDRSSSLVGIAHSRKIQDSLVADALDLPHPDSRFDFAISIAVIHHFSSPERRCHALKSILATLRAHSNDSSEGGRALIYVWALEQKNSRRGWDEGDKQDVFVPWIMPERFSSSKARGGNEWDRRVSDVYNDTSDRVPNATNDGDGGEDGDVEGRDVKNKLTYQRYYHLYRKGELEGDIARAGGRVLESGYEKDNWWAICGPVR